MGGYHDISEKGRVTALVVALAGCFKGARQSWKASTFPGQEELSASRYYGPRGKWGSSLFSNGLSAQKSRLKNIHKSTEVQPRAAQANAEVTSAPALALWRAL